MSRTTIGSPEGPRVFSVGSALAVVKFSGSTHGIEARLDAVDRDLQGGDSCLPAERVALHGDQISADEGRDWR